MEGTVQMRNLRRGWMGGVVLLFLLAGTAAWAQQQAKPEDRLSDLENLGNSSAPSAKSAVKISTGDNA